MSSLTPSFPSPEGEAPLARIESVTKTFGEKLALDG